MRFARTLCASLLLTAAIIVPAAAQRYPGDDVTVNSTAIGRGYLLYPGGRYGRAVRHLLQPGERPGARIYLHMPMHHRMAKSGVSKPVRIASLPPPRVKSQPKPDQQTPVTSDPSALPEDSAARLVGGSTAAAPADRSNKPQLQTPAATSAPANTGATMVPFSIGKPATLATPAPVKRTRTASTTPPPAVTAPSLGVVSGMKKQSSILFSAGESSPAARDVTAIHSLATTLNAALSAGASRIQLDAFGGPRGDKSSESRRLSLKRALVVRELLIEDGVPSEKIDVRAMGGIDDNGVADRVDVFVHV